MVNKELVDKIIYLIKNGIDLEYGNKTKFLLLDYLLLTDISLNKMMEYVKNNYQIINRCEVGAQYNDQWITDADEWTTIVTVPQIQLPDKLPTTGF